MSNLGRRLSEKTKARIGASIVEDHVFNSRFREARELSFSYRYKKALEKIIQLKDAALERKLLDESWSSDGQPINVKTNGACTPASGVMLWKGGKFALVWFDNCDRPVVWQCSNLAVTESTE